MVLIALDQINVGGDIVRQSFLIVLAGRGASRSRWPSGSAGKDWAARRIEEWWPRDRAAAATGDPEPPRMSFPRDTSD